MNYEKCYLRYKYGETYKSIAPAPFVIEPNVNYVILLRPPSLLLAHVIRSLNMKL